MRFLFFLILFLPKVLYADLTSVGNDELNILIKRGINNKNLLIKNFWESFTIHPPVNRLMEIKCIQNIIKKLLLENNSDRSLILI